MTQRETQIVNGEMSAACRPPEHNTGPDHNQDKSEPPREAPQVEGDREEGTHAPVLAGESSTGGAVDSLASSDGAAQFQPWTWGGITENGGEGPLGYYTVGRADGTIVCSVTNGAASDARLIAAAPDLLAALEDVAGLIELYARGDKPQQTRRINEDGSVTVMDGESATQEALDQVLAAIAKATGGAE